MLSPPCLGHQCAQAHAPEAAADRLEEVGAALALRALALEAHALPHHEVLGREGKRAALQHAAPHHLRGEEVLVQLLADRSHEELRVGAHGLLASFLLRVILHVLAVHNEALALHFHLLPQPVRKERESAFGYGASLFEFWGITFQALMPREANHIS